MELEDLAQHHSDLSAKIDKFYTDNSAAHKMLMIWGASALVTIVTFSTGYFFALRGSMAEQREESLIRTIETDTTQTAVLSRLDRIENITAAIPDRIQTKVERVVDRHNDREHNEK